MANDGYGPGSGGFDGGPDPADADDGSGPNVELAEKLFAACKDRPLEAGSPQWRYLTEARGLPEGAIRYCAADIRELKPRIPGFDRLAYGVVSLVRDKDGAITGLAVEACGPAGERILDDKGRTFRRSYALKARGNVDALFRVASAGGEKPMICYAVEGRLAKAVAIAAVFDDPAIYGWGGRAFLGHAVPPEPTVVVIEDARPSDPADAERHDAAYERGCDRLLEAGKTVMRAGPPPEGHKDIDGALTAGVSIEDLRAWILAAAPVITSLDGLARKCARIKDPIKRAEAVAQVIADRELRKTSGMVPAFRKKVEKLGGHRDGGEHDDDELQGQAPDPQDVIPWAAAVDGAALVDRLGAYIEAHVIMPPHAALTCALWVVHCHAVEAAYHTPRLVLRSPTKGCGKSTLRRALSRLVPRAFEAISITGPTLFRPIEQWGPTVFVDEGNEINWAEAGDLRAVINSGHCRDDPGVPRCVGPDFEVRMFRVFAPLCLALIGRLPSPIAERSIVVVMKKKLRTTTVRRLIRKDRDEAGNQLARKAARWAADHVVTLEAAEPELPAALGDRPADNWRPLLAIADAMGLGTKARAAATALSISVSEDADEDLGIQLLVDICAIFDLEGKPQLPSATLITHLLQMEGHPWAELGSSRSPLSKNRMARLLRPFGIHPTGTIRVGASTPKGYLRSAFEDTWRQYSVSSSFVPPQQPPSRHNPSGPPGPEDSQPPHPDNDVAVADGLEPRPRSIVAGWRLLRGYRTRTRMPSIIPRLETGTIRPPNPRRSLAF